MSRCGGCRRCTIAATSSSHCSPPRDPASCASPTDRALRPSRARWPVVATTSRCCIRTSRPRRGPTRGAGRRPGGIVVVGGRVAALAPVPDLAAAIVVDDADEALQEERVPTWHARDVLLERAHRAGARWTVVSAAPTVEAEAVVDFAPDAPPADVEISGWPRVVVVDRREQPPGARLLTEPLADALRDRERARGVRPQPAGPLPAARVRRVSRALALGQQRRAAADLSRVR